MIKPGHDGIARVIKATQYSFTGIKSALKHEAAFRQELFAAIILIPVGAWLGDTGIERALLIGSIVLVLIVELVNSAIEAVVDRFGHEHHHLSARAKDLGSAAVFISILNVIIIWLLILIR